MTVPAIHQAASPVIPHHASEEAYATFVLKHHGSLGSQNYYLQIRREFVEAYPDLRAWFQAPLAQRVGRLRNQPRSHFFGRVSYRARPYLYFLALHGYATFDWEWLISIPNIHLWGALQSRWGPSRCRATHRGSRATGIQPPLLFPRFALGGEPPLPSHRPVAGRSDHGGRLR